MPPPVVYALAAVIVIIAGALAFAAVVNGLDPIILVGLLTTILGYLLPSPISSPLPGLEKDHDHDADVDI